MRAGQREGGRKQPEMRNSDRRSEAPQGGAIKDAGPAELRPKVRSAAGRSEDTRHAELRPKVRSAAGRSDQKRGRDANCSRARKARVIRTTRPRGVASGGRVDV